MIVILFVNIPRNKIIFPFMNSLAFNFFNGKSTIMIVLVLLSSFFHASYAKKQSPVVITDSTILDYHLLQLVTQFLLQLV